MLASIVKKIKAVPSYLYRNYVAPKIYSIRDRKILSRNLELKNKYAGQRCFLIGAGPSIANLNLALLNKEYTFVVNEFEKNKQYRSLTPSFHVIAEQNYYIKDAPEQRTGYFIERGLNYDMPAETLTILNLKAKPFIEKRGLFKDRQIYYIGTQGIFSNNLPFNINLDHYIPNPKNSILMCLMAAAWMDFKEIYLLGCEHSFLAQPLGKSKSLSFSHSYKDETSDLGNASEEILKKYITSKEMNFNYEANMASTLQLFRNYRLFYAKALKNHPDLRIFNATPNSFLDVFPMIDFNDIKLED